MASEKVSFGVRYARKVAVFALKWRCKVEYCPAEVERLGTSPKQRFPEPERSSGVYCNGNENSLVLLPVTPGFEGGRV